MPHSLMTASIDQSGCSTKSSLAYPNLKSRTYSVNDFPANCLNSPANLFCGTGMILSSSGREKFGSRNRRWFFISKAIRSKRMRSASVAALPPLPPDTDFFCSGSFLGAFLALSASSSRLACSNRSCRARFSSVLRSSSLRFATWPSTCAANAALRRWQ